MRINQNGNAESLDEIVLFPFDTYAMPFRNGVAVELNSYSNNVSQTPNIVLGLGDTGAPDDAGATAYGTVAAVGDELWLWYLGQNSAESRWYQRLCLATSRDGKVWQRPSLGLVEFHGSKENNLVNLPLNDHIQSAVVFYEPQDPEPSRRFKMSFESKRYKKRMAIAYSPDGLNWTLSPDNPVGPKFEQSGGTRFNGVYHLTGHGWCHWSPKGWSRKLETHISYDFDTWSQASCAGLERDLGGHAASECGRHSGPQIHLGAALWNRGNLLIGFYGKWNGHPSNDRRLTWMDLGLALSHDGLHYHEPVPDFSIVSAAEVGWKLLPDGDAVVHYPALIQAQGFQNVGEETLFWYSPWPEGDSDGIRVATWPLDRLGHCKAFTGPEQESYVVSQPISLEAKSATILVNADGIGTHSGLVVSVLNEAFKPLPGYGPGDGGVVSESGFRQPVRWAHEETLKSNQPVRLRIDFTGVRPEDVRLYAVYLRHEDSETA